MLGRLGPVLALTAVGAGALLLVLWASMAGPVSVSTHSPSRLPLSTPSDATSSPSPAPSASPSPSAAAPTSASGTGWTGELFGATVVIGLGLLASLLVYRWFEGTSRWRRTARGRATGSPDAVDLQTAGTEVFDREAIRAGLAEPYADQVAALTQLPPRNGIVQAWVLFEDAARRAGVARARAETTTEFVVRLLHLLDIDPAAVGRLRALYVEARFSPHVVGPAERDQARSALAAIHRELALAVPAASPSGSGG